MRMRMPIYYQADQAVKPAREASIHVRGKAFTMPRDTDYRGPVRRVAAGHFPTLWVESAPSTALPACCSEITADARCHPIDDQAAVRSADFRAAPDLRDHFASGR